MPEAATVPCNGAREYSLPGLRSCSTMTTRAARILALIGLTLPPGGCCTMARLFCGPDDSRWISESYASPEAALATFQESLRRADRRALLRCLAESYRQRHELETLSIEIAWRKLTERIPGLHLLGTAEIEEQAVLPDGRRTAVLAVAGHRLLVTLARRSSWELRWTGADGATIEDGAYVPALDPLLIASHEPEAGRTRIAITLPPIDGRVDPQTLTHAALVVEWKVEDLEPIAAEAATKG